MPTSRTTTTGHISVVQEERFFLVTPKGQVLLLTLAHNANVTAEDLQRFRREGTRLRVEPFRKLTREERDDVETEATELAGFLTDGAGGSVELTRFGATPRTS